MALPGSNADRCRITERLIAILEEQQLYCPDIKRQSDAAWLKQTLQTAYQQAKREAAADRMRRKGVCSAPPSPLGWAIGP